MSVCLFVCLSLSLACQSSVNHRCWRRSRPLRAFIVTKACQRRAFYIITWSLSPFHSVGIPATPSPTDSPIPLLTISPLTRPIHSFTPSPTIHLFHHCQARLPWPFTQLAASLFSPPATPPRLYEGRYEMWSCPARWPPSLIVFRESLRAGRPVRCSRRGIYRRGSRYSSTSTAPHAAESPRASLTYQHPPSFALPNASGLHRLYARTND